MLEIQKKCKRFFLSKQLSTSGEDEMYKLKDQQYKAMIWRISSKEHLN